MSDAQESISNEPDVVATDSSLSSGDVRSRVRNALQTLVQCWFRHFPRRQTVLVRYAHQLPGGHWRTTEQRVTFTVENDDGTVGAAARSSARAAEQIIQAMQYIAPMGVDDMPWKVNAQSDHWGHSVAVAPKTKGKRRGKSQQESDSANGDEYEQRPITQEHSIAGRAEGALSYLESRDVFRDYPSSDIVCDKWNGGMSRNEMIRAGVSRLGVDLSLLSHIAMQQREVMRWVLFYILQNDSTSVHIPDDVVGVVRRLCHAPTMGMSEMKVVISELRQSLECLVWKGGYYALPVDPFWSPVADRSGNDYAPHDVSLVADRSDVEGAVEEAVTVPAPAPTFEELAKERGWKRDAGDSISGMKDW